MPVLDTAVIFAAADPEDPSHTKALKHLAKLGPKRLLATFALIEFDIVLKSRGYTDENRMEKLALLLRDFPASATSIHPITPATLYAAALNERSFRVDYFDAAVAAEAMEHDGKVVSTDRAFDVIPGLKRIW